MVWGPLIAGAVSLGSAYLSSKKKKKKAKKLSTFSPEQQRLHGAESQALMGEGGPLADLYSYNPQRERDYFNDQYAQPAYQQFQENVVPTITGQFRGRNLGNSSYAGQALSRAGRDVQSDIDRNLQQYMYNTEQAALQRKQQGVNSLLGRTTFDYERPKEDFLGGLLNQAGGAASQYLLNRYLPGGY